jgi:DNA-directed RNA polymerase specialized sigma24 family protein
VVRDSSDGDKLEALYLRHGPGALRLAYLLTGDRELAEDLAQEAFVRVAFLAGLRSLRTARPSTSPTPTRIR